MKPGLQELHRVNWRILVGTEGQDIIILTPEMIQEEGLEDWAAVFKLGTAGYRDQLDPNDINNPRVAFNRTKVAIIAEAKARVYDRLFGGKARQIERHVGGEVRPHTSEFIELAARVYAAHGHKVHLRKGVDTTPIWYSSFGVFYNDLNDGENFTASHSPNFKGGWKPMDGMGKQILEEAGLIATEVKEVVAPGYRIELAPADSPLIIRDFDATDAYCAYIGSIIPQMALDDIDRAGKLGFKTFISTVGGSMAGTTKPIFRRLHIDRYVHFLHDAEDSNYHGIGIIDGVNYGVDPGKWQTYKHIGAQETLRTSGPGDVFFVWDPDGDRFNIITTAPLTFSDKASSYGLEVDPLTEDRILVYFKPNQIYFMLTLARIEQLRGTGELDTYDWLVAETFPTSRSIGEIAEKHGLRVVRTPVGFKYFGDVAQQIEARIEQGEKDISIQLPTGESVLLGKNPRILIMAEESGGAALGGSHLAVSRNGRRKSVVMKEKDGFQIGLAVMALAARLYSEKKSFAEFYMESIDKHDIDYRYYERLDVTLYDENLPPDELPEAKRQGLARRDRVVRFFKELTSMPVQDACSVLDRHVPGLNLPPLKRVMWAGDGTLMDFDGMWWEIRASGTDAVLRYYIEGRNRESIKEINKGFCNLVI
jgi:phosphomannomutase